MISNDAQPFAPDRTALLLDIDGTLLDIAPTPDAVVVPPALPDNLRALSRYLGGCLAFVSGRAVADIDRIFEPLVLTAVGGHGAELRLVTDGKAQPSRGTAAIDPRLREALKRITTIGDNILVEDKGYSLALHYRLAPGLGAAVIDRVINVVAMAEPGTLEVLPGKAVVEIKRIGINKGNGIAALMQHAPFKERRPIFIGDDVTDEAGFVAANALGGRAFSVGRAVVGAALKFRGPADVRDWLGKLVQSFHAADAARAFGEALDTVPE